MADQKANSVEQKARRFDARLSMQSLSLTGMDWRLEQPVAPAGRRVVRAPPAVDSATSRDGGAVLDGGRVVAASGMGA